MKLPRPVRAVTESFEKLPGIGPKTAQRLAFYLLHVPDSMIDDFAISLQELKKKTALCETCHNIDEQSPCFICTDEQRERTKLCVVESPLDILAFEQTDNYQGLYHVLHGVISPLENIGPDQLYMRDIMQRLDGLEEIILATNPTMEGEATALYIEKIIRDAGYTAEKLKITRIGHGLPVGADIEYADNVTLSRALQGRQEIE